MKFLAVPAIIERVSTRKDRTVSVTIGSNEISPSDMAQLMSMNQKLGYVCFKPEEFTQQELNIIDLLKTDEAIGKSPSQRLRGVLFRCWEQDNKGHKEFSVYYAAEMEKITNHYKDKL